MHAQLFLFCFVLWAKLAGTSVQIYEKQSFGAFSHLGTFPLVFAKVKECLKVEFYEMIRGLHGVRCPIPFFNEWGGQVGVFKVLKNDQFLVF